MGVAEETRVDMRKMGKEAQWMFIQANKDKLKSVRPHSLPLRFVSPLSMNDSFSQTTEPEVEDEPIPAKEEKLSMERILEKLAVPKELDRDQVKAIRIELSLQTNEALDTFRYSTLCRRVTHPSSAIS